MCEGVRYIGAGRGIGMCEGVGYGVRKVMGEEGYVDETKELMREGLWLD